MILNHFSSSLVLFNGMWDIQAGNEPCQNLLKFRLAIPTNFYDSYLLVDVILRHNLLRSNQEVTLRLVS